MEASRPSRLGAFQGRDGNGPRTILLVVNGTDFGGTETSLFQIAVGLARRGFAVHVLSLKSPGRTATRIRERGIPVHTLDMGERVSLSSLFRAAWRLLRILRQGRFDVIHSFLPRANIMSRVANRFSGRARPHLSSERSTDHKRSRLVSSLNRITARWTDRILAVSGQVQRVLVARDGIDEAKIQLLGNCVDLDALAALPPTDIRAELGLAPGAFLFCTAGRLVPDKGHVYLLRALERIVRRGVGVHLALIGEGPEETNLRRERGALGLSDRVHLLGFRGDVVGILKSVDAFVLPSLEEGTPMVLLEAMACGLPCVASAVGGIPEILGGDEAAYLVPPAEIWDCPGPAGQGLAPGEPEALEALARAMEEVVSDDRLRARLASAARKRVATTFGLEAILSELEGIYVEATAGDRRPPVAQALT